MNYKLFPIIFVSVLLAGCAGHRAAVTVPVERSSRDTVSLTATRYDSVFIYNNVYTDRTRDTLLIRETTTEHRYRILHDTVRIVRRDSVPYEVRVPATSAAPRRDSLAVRLLPAFAALAVIAIFIKSWPRAS